MNLEILTKDDITEATQLQVSTLFKQLSSRKQESLKTIFSQKTEVVFAICKEDDKVIGTALMACYCVISGYKGWIEDVVVDSNHRGKGIGRKLIEKLIKEGKSRQLREILLFTEDEKVPAINLYKSLEFALKESRIYNLKM